MASPTTDPASRAEILQEATAFIQSSGAATGQDRENRALFPAPVVLPRRARGLTGGSKKVRRDRNGNHRARAAARFSDEGGERRRWRVIVAALIGIYVQASSSRECARRP